MQCQCGELIKISIGGIYPNKTKPAQAARKIELVMGVGWGGGGGGGGGGGFESIS